MQQLDLLSAQGQPYRVNLPEPKAGFRSGFLFSYHKSGSTLMDGMVRTYCKVIRVPTFSLFNAAFDAGIPTNEIGPDATRCFQPEGVVYTGFRHFPMFELGLQGHPCIWLVRDPRDMLVSLYYSVTLSHAVPPEHRLFREKRELAQSLSLEEFVLRNASTYLRSFERYREKLPRDSLTTYRYEDVIYAKADWLKALVGRLGLPLRRRLVRLIARRYDVFPGKEVPDAHVRQVHPGNHRAKLSAETRHRLGELLAPILDFHGYSRDDA